MNKKDVVRYIPCRSCNGQKWEVVSRKLQFGDVEKESDPTYIKCTTCKGTDWEDLFSPVRATYYLHLILYTLGFLILGLALYVAVNDNYYGGFCITTVVLLVAGYLFTFTTFVYNQEKFSALRKFKDQPRPVEDLIEIQASEDIKEQKDGEEVHEVYAEKEPEARQHSS